MTTLNTPKIFTLPIAFTKNYEDILKRGTKIGQEKGKGKNWTPKHFNQAIMEILLFGDKEDGIIPVFQNPDFGHSQKTFYPLEVKILIHKTEEEFIESAHENFKFSKKSKLTIEEALLLYLNLEASPNDLEFEFYDAARPPRSNHELLYNFSLGQIQN